MFLYAPGGLVSEECPSTIASFSCAEDSIPRKRDRSRWRHLFTLFLSSLSGDDTDLGEDKAGEFLKHTARQSTSPTKYNELVGLSNLSIGTSNYYSNTTGFLTTSSNARFLKAVVAGDAELDGRILTLKLKNSAFSELESATSNFRPDVLLGEGGFWKVYTGWVDEKTLAPSRWGSGILVAVKKLNPESIEGFNEWQAEMKFVGGLSHPNIVRLLGYCWKDKESFLVSEFMQKGSLDNHLFRIILNLSGNPSIQPLSWEKRLKIAIGAARGLTFLHGSEKQVIYRDFKTSNIFIDSGNMQPFSCRILPMKQRFILALWHLD
ncbi:probable serine/threonine-protein kinase PIX13 isoform X1 [Punica granatum]|uniref:Probable serine/threonine-protein kinase PIX13 isoform X1 n=1 Tax=Punica granatum TaxID=22663 RepID=A0A6P8DT18_PUNGR|nr:probable serine/threonine-protein kinase PIX13 isoform X1 [Punica granatum]XP_031400576.1 probable serine/threonine-protein kinase PIX13 isoform X1 [Punica granatum]XP_031400577.1 probable serine/threonine-protein kinase PIX13 isoform X1 [Punica granatum]XP_031400578.1 probable serine/threonine-protein kinase PIX13 isoform X1 [Punica granatum]